MKERLFHDTTEQKDNCLSVIDNVEAVFVFCAVSVSKWVAGVFGEAHFLTGMIPLCVDAYGILFFLSNLNSDKQFPVFLTLFIFVTL